MSLGPNIASSIRDRSQAAATHISFELWHVIGAENFRPDRLAQCARILAWPRQGRMPRWMQARSVKMDHEVAAARFLIVGAVTVVGVMTIICSIMASGRQSRNVCAPTDRAARRSSGSASSTTRCRWPADSSMRCGCEREQSVICLIGAEFNITCY
jgi:hypothetical protein